MLVVTRRPSQRIVFPSLGITVHLLKWAKGAARIGIEAPPEIPVLRDELLSTLEETARRSRHDLANTLSKATLAVQLAQKQVEAGRSEAAIVTLNLAMESLEALVAAHRPPALPDGPPAPRRCHALIVEDDVNQRELLAGLLGMNGCQCDQVGDGEDALAYLDSGRRPDVILLDMALPRCDGPATLRRIRADERFARVKVFSLSSTPPHELGIADGPTGFDAWFAKPLNPQRLWEVMQESVCGPNSSN